MKITKSIAKAVFNAFVLALAFLACPNSAKALNLQNKFTDFSINNDFYENDSYIFTKNDYTINAKSLKNKGFTNTKDIITATPFVSTINSGYGDIISLRASTLLGGGASKFYINGFDASSTLANFSGFSPLTFIPTAFIDELSLQPQSLATQFGSGTKGGVININTLSRQEAFEIGAKYEQGYSSHILYNGGLFKGIFVNLGFAYNALNDFIFDKATQMQAKFTLFWDLNEQNEMLFGVNFMQAKADEYAPNSFLGGFANYESIEAGYKYNPYPNSIRNLYVMMYREKEAQAGDLNPDSTELSGTPRSLNQQWLNFNLGYKIAFTPKTSLDLRGFYATNAVKKGDLAYTKDFFEWGGFVYKNAFLNSTELAFDERKMGFNAEFAWDYSYGKFTLGTQNLIENASTKDAFSFENEQKFVISGNNHAQFSGDYSNEFKIMQSKNAVYASKRLDLGRAFSLTGGGRYELYKANLKVNGEHKNEHRYIYHNATAYDPNYSGFGSTSEDYDGEDSKKFIAYELLASVKYSNSGLIYARYERGYTALPVQFLAQRSYKNLNNPTPTIQDSTGANRGNRIHIAYADLEYEKTSLDDEVYDSFELGFKDFYAGENSLFTLNANAYYIGTRNEFYQMRNYNPFIEIKLYQTLANAVYAVNPSVVGVWDETRRMGVELFFSQFLLNGSVNFNESLAYQKAEFRGENGWEKMPYAYDYKATLEANIELFKWLNFWGNASFFGSQKVVNKFYTTRTNTVGNTSYQVPATQPLASGGNGEIIVENSKNESLPSFWLLDLGLGLRFGGLFVSAGVKNLLDTLHYDYYNRDSINSNVGNAYVISKGRRFFVEANFTW